ncbi:MAG: type II secretion system secretin GspD [Pseudomonadota bacterium]
MSRNPSKWLEGSVVVMSLFIATMTAGCAGNKKLSEQGAVMAPSGNEAAGKKDPGKPAEDARSQDRYSLYPGTGVLVKPVSSKPYQQVAGELTLNFEGADLREVVKTVLSDILKESYIMDPRVAGSITLHTRRPIPRSAVLPTLETVLRMSGAVLLRQDDGVYQVLPANLAGKGNLTPRLAELDKRLPGGYSIQIVPLKFIGVTDMAKLLEPVLPDPSAVRVDLLRNILVLSGTEPELRHMFETIEMFDVDWLAGMSVGLFTLQNVEANTIVTELEKLFGDKSLGPLAGALRLMPIERLNALLVVTPQEKYLDQAKTWIERLDRSGAGSGGQSLYVYQVQNGKAEQLAELLNDVFGKGSTQKDSPQPTLAPGAKPAEVSSPGGEVAKPVVAAQAKSSANSAAHSVSVSQNVRVIADKDNNALLILASASDFEKIEMALRKLDVVPRQVLIEVTIAEVTLKDELAYGLEWFMNKGRISSRLDAGESGVSALAPGLSYSWTSLSGDITAVLNMLATDSKLKIISSPHITVADNQKASIQVGDQVPTITQTQTTNTTTGVISSVQYLNTGVLLNVTPRVNASGLVTLEINQEISNASKTTSSSIDSPTIQKRTAQSTVTVQSNETLVMAGLIKEENSRAADGLPLLSEVPVLGGLFGKQSRTDNRTELIILITPRVLHTVAQAAAVTDEYRKRVTGLSKMIKLLDRGVSEADGMAGAGPMPAKAIQE